MLQKIRPDLNLGKNIRILRLQKKLSQDAVVAQLQLMGFSISRSTYAKIETNRMNIRVSELLGLQKIFCAEISDFFVDLKLPDEG